MHYAAMLALLEDCKVKVRCEDPRQPGMARYYVGKVLRCTIADGLLLSDNDGGLQFDLEKIESVELSNPHYEKRPGRIPLRPEQETHAHHPTDR